MGSSPISDAFLQLFHKIILNKSYSIQYFAPSTLFILFTFNLWTFDLFLVLFILSFPSCRFGESIFLSNLPIIFLLFIFYFYLSFYLPFSFYFDSDFFFVSLWLNLFYFKFFYLYFDFDFFVIFFSPRFSLLYNSVSFFILVVYIQNLFLGLFFFIEVLLWKSLFVFDLLFKLFSNFDPSNFLCKFISV